MIKQLTPCILKNMTAVLGLAVPLAWAAAAQDVAAPAGLPQFEIASVKPIEPNVPHKMGVHVYPGGRVEIAGFALRNLISTAFDVPLWQISGGDPWTSKEEYLLQAKPPDTLRSSIKTLRYTLFGIDDPLLRQMLQSLLIDRFQLKFHRESKSADVHLLVRNQKPLALQEAKIPEGAAESDSFGSIGYVDGKWGIFATTMPQLAKFASMIVHAPVLDHTELPGVFDYRQRQPELAPRYGGEQIDSFKDFLGQAGFKLERAKGTIETFVIDGASKPGQN